MKKLVILVLALVILLGLVIVVVPPLREQAGLYIASWRADIFYAFNPPEKDVFIPESVVAAAVQSTLAALPTNTPAEPTVTPTILQQTVTPAPTTSPTLVPTPLPKEVQLRGTRHEYQQWNNCGPATLSVNLSFWGWQGDQRNTAGWIKPNSRDKNTSAYELVDYVKAETSLDAILRVGGDLETVKKLVAAGFPVIVERGFDGYDNEGWMGHYELVTGYSDEHEKLITQDVLIMADFPIPYEEMANYWRAFNRVFVVVFPPERKGEVLMLLGPLSNEQEAFQRALSQSEAELNTLTGREQFFAWFNRGTNLLALGDPLNAASAYDQAFALYALLPEENRPWRMVWYQHGVYEAYFLSGRYQDVINLADHTLSRTGEPALEESFLWRGRAWSALGNQEKAVSDLRSALKWHPNWQPALAELARLGATP